MEHALLTTLTELAASGDSDAIAAALRDLDVGAPSLIDALTARDLGETLHTAPEHVRPGSWVMEPLAVCAEWPQIARAVSEVLARQAPTADFVASTCERALEAPSPPLLCAIGLLAEHPAWRAWEAAAPRIFRAIAWRIAHEADTLLYAHTATMSARCIRSIETAGRFGMTVALAVPYVDLEHSAPFYGIMMTTAKLMRVHPTTWEVALGWRSSSTWRRRRHLLLARKFTAADASGADGDDACGGGSDGASGSPAEAFDVYGASSGAAAPSTQAGTMTAQVDGNG